MDNETKDEELSTEQEILDGIIGGSDGDNETQSDDVTPGSDSKTQADPKSSTDQAGGQTTSTGTKDEQTGTKAPGPQDLVGKDGQVIAVGGKERRFYEAAQTSKREVITLTKQLDDATIRLKAFDDAGSVGKQYELTPEEVVTGAQLMSSYKKDPVSTIKYMLTEAQASGHNIDDIGTTDMTAMKKMLDEAMKPLTDQRQAELDTQENTAQAKEQYNAFMGKYPDAAVHEDTIAQLLNEDPSLSPDAAYFKLQSYYATKNLDWKMSLAMLKAQPAQTSGTENTQLALPDGNSIAPNRVTDKPEIADVNTSTGDIIKEAMAEAGYKL